MADVKDILGVSRSSAKPELKKEKEKVQRPAGMSREAFALFDGSHPIAPSLTESLRKKEDLQGLKKKWKTPKGAVIWQRRAFENQGRSDGLKLKHWEKCTKDTNNKIRPFETGDYKYVKYNKKMLVYKYSEEEWNNVIAKDPEWSREETDYLLDLCLQLDLRFLIIADRYEFSGAQRAMEDLKGRYYSIARQLMVAREGSQEDIENTLLIKAPFDANHEKQAVCLHFSAICYFVFGKRKRALLMIQQRTPQQEAEENMVLEQAQAIEAARQAEEAEKRATNPSGAVTPQTAPVDIVMLEFQDSVVPGTSSLLGPTLQPVKPLRPSVVCRRAHTKEQAQLQLASVTGGARGVKTLEGTLTDLNVAEPPRAGVRSVCGAWLALRAEVIEMLELKKRLLARQGAATPVSSDTARLKRGPSRKV